MRHQHIAVADVSQRPLQQRLVRVALRRHFVAEKAGRRPADVREAASLRRGQRARRGTPARRAPDGVEPAAGMAGEGFVDPAQLVADRRRGQRHGAAGVVAELRPVAHAAGLVGDEAPMAPGVTAEGMALVGARLPVRSPGWVERVVAAGRLLVGKKEGCAHLVAPQDGGDLLRVAHVAGVQREIDVAAAGWLLRHHRGRSQKRHAGRCRQPAADAQDANAASCLHPPLSARARS
jgi:hypothetical protein